MNQTKCPCHISSAISYTKRCGNKCCACIKHQRRDTTSSHLQNMINLPRKYCHKHSCQGQFHANRALNNSNTAQKSNLSIVENCKGNIKQKIDIGIQATNDNKEKNFKDIENCGPYVEINKHMVSNMSDFRIKITITDDQSNNILQGTIKPKRKIVVLGEQENENIKEKRKKLSEQQVILKTSNNTDDNWTKKYEHNIKDQQDINQNVTVCRKIDFKPVQLVKSSFSNTDKIKKIVFENDSIGYNKTPIQISDKVISTTKTEYVLPDGISINDIIAADAENENRRNKIVTKFKKDLNDFFINHKAAKVYTEKKINELVCFFRQILEDFLIDVLKKMSPIYIFYMSLLEALKYICIENKENFNLMTIVDCLKDIIERDIDEYGNFGSTMEPGDLIRMYGCGILLMQHLKTLQPQFSEYDECEKLLMNLFENQEDTFSLDIPSNINALDDVIYVESVSMTNDARVLQYLKRHYPLWESYGEPKLVPESKNMKNTQEKIDPKDNQPKQAKPKFNIRGRPFQSTKVRSKINDKTKKGKNTKATKKAQANDKNLDSKKKSSLSIVYKGNLEHNKDLGGPLYEVFVSENFYENQEDSNVKQKITNLDKGSRKKANSQQKLVTQNKPNDTADEKLNAERIYATVKIFANWFKNYLKNNQLFIENEGREAAFGNSINDEIRQKVHKHAKDKIQDTKKVLIQLNCINRREQRPETALIPKVLKVIPEAIDDKRITEYRELIRIYKLDMVCKKEMLKIIYNRTKPLKEISSMESASTEILSDVS